MANINLEDLTNEHRYLINKGLALLEILVGWEKEWKNEPQDPIIEKTLEAADFVLNRLHQMAELVDNFEPFTDPTPGHEPALRDEVED